jgi:hypothetical protein
MSEEEFLKRWSRRKREAADVARPDESETKADDGAEATPQDRAADADKPQPEFDPATLPPIESLTALSDATAFLRAGVPADLTRAALRRVWTVDPAIRDFVGLAENAWDFTDPNAMPGFGPLEDTEEIRRMIATIVDSIGGQPKQAAENVPDGRETVEDLNDSSEIGSARSEQTAPQEISAAAPAERPDVQILGDQVLGDQVLLQSKNTDGAVQNDPTEVVEKPKQITRHTHGSALPE